MSMRLSHRRRLITKLLVGALLTVISLVVFSFIAHPASSAARWLEIRQVKGTVFHRGSQSGPARAGDRLRNVGDGLVTGNGSTATLVLDDGISPLRVTANTEFRIQNLSTSSGGGKVTILSVSRGQVRFQVRRFNNPGSLLEVRTPSGVASVRGTDFGVNVRENGTTGVATRSGSVAVNAQKKTVLLSQGFGALMELGKPPTPPQSFPSKPELSLQSLTRQGSNQVRVVANTNALNTVWLGTQAVPVQKDGSIDALLPLSPNQLPQLVVRDPLGEELIYQFQVP